MPLPRPKLYEKPSQRHQASRERLKKDREQNKKLAGLLSGIIEAAERRRFIVVENVPVEEKAEKLLRFLETVEESQLRILEPTF